MYKKCVKDGIIIYVGIDCGGDDITESEYNAIMSKIKTIPSAPNGYQYAIRDIDMDYILIPLEPPIIEPDDEAKESDFIDALNTLGVTTNEEN